MKYKNPNQGHPYLKLAQKSHLTFWVQMLWQILRIVGMCILVLTWIQNAGKSRTAEEHEQECKQFHCLWREDGGWEGCCWGGEKRKDVRCIFLRAIIVYFKHYIFHVTE